MRKWRLHHRHRLRAPIHERRCRWQLTWVSHWHANHWLGRHHRTLWNLLFSSRGFVALGTPRPGLPSRGFGPTVAIGIPLRTLLLPLLMAMPLSRMLLLIVLPALRVFRTMDVCPVDHKVPWHIARRAMKCGLFPQLFAARTPPWYICHSGHCSSNLTKKNLIARMMGL